jgi:hypothetical protein
MIVEYMGHVASLTGSLFISLIPIAIFGLFMPETLGQRGSATHKGAELEGTKDDAQYREMT